MLFLSAIIHSKLCALIDKIWFCNHSLSGKLTEQSYQGVKDTLVLQMVPIQHILGVREDISNKIRYCLNTLV